MPLTTAAACRLVADPTIAADLAEDGIVWYYFGKSVDPVAVAAVIRKTVAAADPSIAAKVTWESDRYGLTVYVEIAE